MLVDDVPDQQRLYSHFLQRAGAEVTLECNGVAAVTTATQSADAFDCIVMDLKMPLLDGLAATIELRRRGYDGAILAFTAAHDEETRRIWLAAGCNAYLRKPVATKTFVETVERLTQADLRKSRDVSSRTSDPQATAV